MQIITPFNVYFNAQLIFKKGEVWRLLTNFFFFGNLGELSNQLVHAHHHALVQSKMPKHYADRCKQQHLQQQFFCNEAQAKCPLISTCLHVGRFSAI
jgi:hypothetical protein